MPNEQDIKTHKKIDAQLCGTPQNLTEGEATVEMTTTKVMTVDDEGLVHGGFVFGLADHAAMLAVNHPFVVLAASNCRFLKPVRANEQLTAHAKITGENGKKRTVEVNVIRGDDKVFSGEFTCAILEKHVLA